VHVCSVVWKQWLALPTPRQIPSNHNADNNDNVAVVVDAV